MMHKNNPRLTYQEYQTLEPLVRASQVSDEILAQEASKVLKHHVTTAQMWYFRMHILQLPPPIARWKLSKEDVLRLTELLQREPHVVVNRGRKRVYMTTFSQAMKQRQRCLKNRIWEKANGVHGLASASAPDS